VSTDHELLERWRAGERAAGEELFARYFDDMYRFFSTKIDGDIDELVQSTFLACVRAKDQFRGDASFTTYLYTVARHTLYRQYRHRRRHDERLDFHITSVAELVTTPRSALARNQAHRELLEAMCRLPVETQMLLELHYWEDLDAAALGEIFESPPTTIRTRLRRARIALREQLRESTAAPADALASEDGLEQWARGMRPAHPPPAKRDVPHTE
jgi:RNA polymerase sigma factor (sigma-70 family)